MLPLLRRSQSHRIRASASHDHLTIITLVKTPFPDTVKHGGEGLIFEGGTKFSPQDLPLQKSRHKVFPLSKWERELLSVDRDTVGSDPLYLPNRSRLAAELGSTRLIPSCYF